jgi:hypothetical protein
VVAALSGTGRGASRADPHAEYARRRDERAHEAAGRARLVRLVSNLRLVVFVVGLVLVWLAFGADALAPGWLAAPLGAFLALVVAHDRVIRGHERAERCLAFYERGLARLEDRWAGGGESGERFRDRQHPCGEDLDLFGTGSLYELLCTARTQAGEQLLADWLRTPAAPPVIRERQAAVEELRPRLDLREDLAALGDAVRAGLHADALRRWGEAPALLRSGGLRWAAAGLPTISVVTLAAWALGLSGPVFFELALVVQTLFALVLRPRVMRVVRAADLPARDLALLAELFARIEAARFEAPALVRLRAALDTEGVPPSRRTAGLRLRIDLLDARRNQLFVPIGALLLWTTQLAFAIERWRAACGPALERWIAALGEIEALAALASAAYENPEHAFPDIELEGDVFEAEALGHPLLPAKRCERNDLCLGGGLGVLVVSGSNMSGKSTLLRTVGTNAVLALAGAPVRARRLRIGPLVLGASIRVQDSLMEGRSRFYAEIGRLRSLVELAEGGQTLLFLIDEILHGTNSHDRGVGAEAIIRGLVERGALGLVTTHDLALAKVADALAPRAANVHFEDHLEDGKIAFDYRMRPGVVEKSNALELMRSVGLDV